MVQKQKEIKSPQKPQKENEDTGTSLHSPAKKIQKVSRNVSPKGKTSRSPSPAGDLKRKVKLPVKISEKQSVEYSKLKKELSRTKVQLNRSKQQQKPPEQERKKIAPHTRRAPVSYQ